ALAKARGEVVLHALANLHLGIAYCCQGAYQWAIDCFGQTVASLNGVRRHERFGELFLPAVFSRAWLALCHAELGTFVEGSTLGEEGRRVAGVAAPPASLMWAYYAIGLLSLRQGNVSRALPRLERAMSLCQDADLLFYFRMIAPPLGVVYTLGGRVADAVPLLTQAIEQMTAREIVVMQVPFRLFLCD